ncbi:hypothetical protein [Fulvitalea axinellae]
MQFIEVNDKGTVSEFLRLPLKIYKNEPNWIRPLDQDIESVFDKKKNKFFRHGQCVRWILQDNGQTVGRIGAFFSKKTMNKGNDQPTGGVGFFECLDNQEYANALFDKAKAWLEDKGLEAMDGPINFGDRDRFWGLLVDGFDIPPNYMCNYNPTYYQALFENYGFQTYFGQLTFGRKTIEPVSEKLHAKAERVHRDPKYHFEHVKMKNLEKYTEDFLEVYNQAWGGHKGVAKLNIAQARSIMKSMKPIMDERIVWFGYYGKQPIAFFIMLPEVNQIFRHVGGKLDIIGKLKFVYHKWRKTCTKMVGMAFGIIPAHQGKGVEGALVNAAGNLVQKEGFQYEDFEMNWIGDFNPKMIHVCEQVGGSVVKTHRTYRKLFDESKPFKRHPIINGGKEESDDNKEEEK